MNTSMYIVISLMMFFEYAIWGAWMPVLAARLLGPMKLNGKQTGWVYATLPLACMIATPIAGQLADTMVDAKWILVACHLLGALLLFLASRQQTFGGIFGTMFLYSFCYAATIPLVNAVMFAHLEEAGVESGSVFIWAPVAWALIGYLLTGYRSMQKEEGDGTDCLKLGAVCSLIMVVVCFLQPATPPGGAVEGGGLVGALSLMSVPAFAVFVIVTFFVAGLQQFYFLGSAQMMQDIGLSNKAVPGAMAVAQVTQALATLLLLGVALGMLGFTWTLTLGILCWSVLFFVYVVLRTPFLVVPIQAFHGLAYVFFIIVGQIYGNAVADEAMRSSVQSLIIFLQAGLSLFLATQLAGFVMSKNTGEDGKFDWAKIYAVPLVITLVGALVLAIGMSDPAPAEEPAQQAVEQVEDGEAAAGEEKAADADTDKAAGGEETKKTDADK